MKYFTWIYICLYDFYQDKSHEYIVKIYYLCNLKHFNLEYFQLRQEFQPYNAVNAKLRYVTAHHSTQLSQALRHWSY
jgi:hypothetical protein